MRNPIDVMSVAHAFLVVTSLKSTEGSTQIQDHIYVMNLDASIEQLTQAVYGNTKEHIPMNVHTGKQNIFVCSSPPPFIFYLK